MPQLLSAFFYSCAGGFADATGFLLAGSFAGHITGNLVLVSISGAAGHWRAMSRPLGAIIAFLLATEIGILSAKRCSRDLTWILLMVQSLTICTLALPVLRRDPWFDLVVVMAFAVCLRLQNGVVNSIDGVGVHPSYMSGTATRLLRSWPAGESHGQRPQNDANFNTSIISGGALAGFVVGALFAVAAKASAGSYAPVLLCLPLLAAAIASSRIL